MNRQQQNVQNVSLDALLSNGIPPNVTLVGGQQGTGQLPQQQLVGQNQGQLLGQVGNQGQVVTQGQLLGQQLSGQGQVVGASSGGSGQQVRE